jgi:hypothetical protein
MDKFNLLSTTTQLFISNCFLFILHKLQHNLYHGVDNIFETSKTYCDKTIICITFQKFKIGTLKESIIITTTPKFN